MKHDIIIISRKIEIVENLKFIHVKNEITPHIEENFLNTTNLVYSTIHPLDNSYRKG